MELIIVAPEPKSFVYFRKLSAMTPGGPELFPVKLLQAEWGNRNIARNKGFTHSQGKWVYFLDQDIRFPDLKPHQAMERLNFLDGQQDETWIVAGPYLDAPGIGYWGRSYNWFSNLWLIHGFGNGRALAGNLVLRREIPLKKPFNDDLIEGGEESELCSNAFALGGKAIYAGLMAMEHKNDASVMHCWRRFRSHMKAKNKIDKSFSRTPISYSVLKEIALRPHYWPLIGLYLAARASRF